MVTIYHNPRCGKSRTALAHIEENGIEHSTRLYLKDPLNESDLKRIFDKLQGNKKDMIRTNEADFKENFKGQELTEKLIIDAIAQYPKLLQRPIIEYPDSAVIARSEEALEQVT